VAGRHRRHNHDARYIEGERKGQRADDVLVSVAASHQTDRLLRKGMPIEKSQSESKDATLFAAGL